MEASSLSSTQRMAIAAAFEYWLEHWDWEMPTLTGMEIGEFERVAQAWRSPTPIVTSQEVLAALGAVRECWAQVPEASFVLGLSPNSVQELVNLLAKEVDRAV